MNVDAAAIDALRSLREERKFSSHLLYPGAPNEETRTHCETWVNTLIDSLLDGLPSSPTKSLVLSQFKSHLDHFGNQDTDERERVCGYCEQIMDILGIESSEGVLNNWLYGFESNDRPSGRPSTRCAVSRRLTFVVMRLIRM